MKIISVLLNFNFLLFNFNSLVLNLHFLPLNLNSLRRSYLLNHPRSESRMRTRPEKGRARSHSQQTVTESLQNGMIDSEIA